MKSDNLATRRKPAATFLAVALSATLATYGCTTNRLPGSGEPTRSPNVGGAPTSIPGTSGGTSGAIGAGTTSGSGFTAVRSDVPRPMYSSSGQRLTADQAAAIMAQHQPARATYLGPSNPGPTMANGVTAPTGQFSWPALQTNPQITVNSSISSPATPAIVSGAGGADASGIVAGGVAVGGFDAAGGAAFVGGVVAPTTATVGTSPGFVAGTPAATAGTSPAGVGATSTAGGTTGAVFSNNATALTPTSAALPLTAGTFAAGAGAAGTSVSPISGSSTGSLTPTLASANVPTPTTTLNPSFANQQQSNARLATPTNPDTVNGTQLAGGTTSGATIGRSSALRAGRTTAARVGGGTSTGSASGTVRVINNNGRVVITNNNGGAAQR